jgi:hypothetical protein
MQLLPAGGVLSLPGSKEEKMRNVLVVLAIAMPLTLLSGVGSAKGCLKGAAVGGVVGHVAGHHAVVGAAAGCVIEHHREKVRDREAAKQNATAQHATVQNKPADQATPSPDQHW